MYIITNENVYLLYIINIYKYTHNIIFLWLV